MIRSVAGYKFEKDIPLERQQPKAKRIPFALMEVGESLFLEGETMQTILSQLSVARQDKSKLYIARTITGGVRIWRMQ